MNLEQKIEERFGRKFLWKLATTLLLAIELSTATMALVGLILMIWWQTGQYATVTALMTGIAAASHLVIMTIDITKKR